MSESSIIQPLSHPKLRHTIDIRRQIIDGEELLIFECPLEISVPLALKSATGAILAMFDGTNSVDEIALRFADFGVTTELITNLAVLLDSHLYLDSGKFTAKEAEIKREFTSNPKRPATRAGYIYPAEAQALHEMLEGYLAEGRAQAVPPSKSMLALVAPHIDYRRGGACYGITYSAFADANPSVIILIGTSHQYSRGLFHLTMKDFESPIGEATVAKDFTSRLANSFGKERSYRDEYLHKKEHSLELQVPFIKRTSPHSLIVPILVGSFYPMMIAGNLPSVNEEYESFAASLAEQLKKLEADGGNYCFVAGVDMAHVGKQFGDEESLTPEKMEIVAQRDEIYLRLLADQDYQGMYAHIAEDNDARKICGYPTMYTVLDVLSRLSKNCQARVFDYRQTVSYENECAVTFAGAGFYADSPPR